MFRSGNWRLMLVALITDTHFGARNDNVLFQDYFNKFYDQVFFLELRKRRINSIIHLGDLFERRKQINFHILHRTRIEFLERVEAGKFDFHVLVGNHDTYFRDLNDINSIRELCSHYSKFHIYEEPQEIVIDGLRILLVPWLNPTNMPIGLDMIARTKAKVLMGHLEVAGFHMDQTQICEHGLDKKIFSRFAKVFSGHFHHSSEEGPIKFLGAPYEMTRADLSDPKGFYIFDTDTYDLEFIKNPFKMFYKLVYDDRDKATHQNFLDNLDFKEFENKFLKLVVPFKTDPILFEQYIESLRKSNPADLQIAESYSLEVSEEAENEIMKENVNVLAENSNNSNNTTLDIVNQYIDSIGLEINKDRLKDEVRQLWVEVSASQNLK